jgi:hypothetical protein
VPQWDVEGFSTSFPPHPGFYIEAENTKGQSNMTEPCHICGAPQLTQEERAEIAVRRAKVVEATQQRELHLASNDRTTADFERRQSA